MKRYISLVLAAVVLIFSLAVPSYAAESQWFDVLEYASPNNSDGNIVNIKSGDTITFDLPAMEGGYYDLVVQFRTTITSITAISSNGSYSRELNILQIDDHTFRIYGYVGLVFTNGINLTLNFTNLYDYIHLDVSFLSFRVSNVLVYNSHSRIDGVIYHGEADVSYFTYSDLPVSVSLPGNSSFSYDQYHVYLDFPEWQKYDYIELELMFLNLSVNSIACFLDDENVPVTISYLDADNSFSDSLLTLSIDLTGINRDSVDPLSLTIYGDVPSIDGNYGSFHVIYSSGFLKASEVSLWSQFKNVLGSHFFELTGNLSSWFGNVGTWISNQTSSLTNSLSGWFSNIGTWISNQTSSLTNSLSGWFSNVSTWLSIQTNSITASISSWGQKIVDVLTPDTDAADSVVDKTQQQADQMDDNINGFQQLERPDFVGGVTSGDISSIVTPGNTVKYTLFLSRIMQAPVLSDVIMLSMIFSLAAYVLFGKR